MRGRFFAFIAATAMTSLADPAFAEEVECKGAKAVLCMNKVEGWCQDAQAFAMKFTVDRQAGTVTDGDGEVYKIVPTPELDRAQSIIPLFEYSITVTGKVATADWRTMVLGQKSFVYSKISSYPPRVLVQFGTCTGLAAP